MGEDLIFYPILCIQVVDGLLSESRKEADVPICEKEQT